MHHSSDNGKHGVGAAFLLRNQAALERGQNILYVFGNKGIAVFDTSDPTNPRRIFMIATGAIAGDSGGAAAIHGAFMYVVGGKGLRVFDVAEDAWNPKPLGKKAIDLGALSRGGGAALKIVGNHMYVAGGKGLVVLSLADPAAPAKIGDKIDTKALSLGGGASLCVVGNILRVVGGHGFTTFSLANPAVPVQVQKCTDSGCITLGGCNDWAEAPDGSWIVAGGKGVTFWDTGPIADSSKTQLERIGNVHTTGVLNLNGGVAMVVSDGLLYLAGGKGLGVFRLAGAPRGGENLVDSRQQTINTTVISGDNDTAMLLEGQTLWVLGGKGLAALSVGIMRL
jgi:hypothetical protein